jgi:tetratricopeptide (TPR) repeat protein
MTGSPDADLRAATAATRQGRLDEAAPLAWDALARFEARGDRDGALRATNLLGAIAFERGALADAAARFGRALGIAGELGDALMVARASNNLASLQVLADDPGGALPLYRAALLAYRRLGDRRGAAEALHNIALAHRRLGRWADAEEAAAEAVRSAEVAGEPALVALALTGRAETDVQRGEPELARTRADRALELARSGGDEIGVGEALRVRAMARLAAGAAADAAEDAAAARAVAAAHGSALLNAESTAVLARALRALGRRDDAESARAEARARLGDLGAVGLIREFEAAWGAR